MSKSTHITLDPRTHAVVKEDLLAGSGSRTRASAKAKLQAGVEVVGEWEGRVGERKEESDLPAPLTMHMIHPRVSLPVVTSIVGEWLCPTF